MANQIKCPKCGEIFQVDETMYASIVEQIKAEEIQKEVEKALATQAKENALNTELMVAREKSKTDAEFNRLKNLVDSLQKKIDDMDKAKEYEVTKVQKESLDKIRALEQEIAVNTVTFNAELKAKDTQIETAKKENEEAHKMQVKALEDQVAYYKDLKTKLSTKLVGETLEQHCKIEFDRVRPIFGKNVYFEKDNAISESGSKGDFIYREVNDEGNEVISIMFEMKNENETTATKHKNEDFLKELDKDRNEKKCEYAVLVSMLEADSEYYNAGIVDVSHKYNKMYVVRPQCFIPIITLLRNASMNVVEYKNQLQEVKNQNIDIANFEAKLFDFQTGLTRNYNLAKDKFNTAIEEIDKTIVKLTKVKESLLGSENNLRLATEKANELTIKKLTKDNPTMKARFDSLKDSSNNG